MFGFEALPPEINSGLMYSGPGAGPMTAASAAWGALSDELYQTASAYGSALTDLKLFWRGPSSLAMAAAGSTYVSWISATAAQAERTAAQAKAAVAAYESAFAMTVPPAAIAANRALLLALVATNFFGQNTPAIMAVEAEYLEMWAQDAAAMYGYAFASFDASTITPFVPPQAATNSSGVAGMAAAVMQAAGTPVGSGAQAVSPLASAAAPGALQAVASTATSSSGSTSPLSLLTAATSTSSGNATTAGAGLASGAGSTASMLTSAASGLGSSATSFSPASSTFSGGFPMSSLNLGASSATGALSSPGAAVSAASGRAAALGVLSVPQSWTSAAPAFGHVASALPAGSGLPPAPAPASPASPFSLPSASSTSRSANSSPVPAQHYFRPAVVQRPVYTG